MSLFTSILNLVALAAWLYVVLTVEPIGIPAQIAFFGPLFVAATCTLGQLFGREEPRERAERDTHWVPDLVHGAIVSTLLLFALWLQSLRMLTPFHVILFASMCLLIELGFFLSGSRPRTRPRRPPRRAAVPGTGSLGDG